MSLLNQEAVNNYILKIRFISKCNWIHEIEVWRKLIT